MPVAETVLVENRIHIRDLYVRKNEKMKKIYIFLFFAKNKAKTEKRIKICFF